MSSSQGYTPYPATDFSVHAAGMIRLGCFPIVGISRFLIGSAVCGLLAGCIGYVDRPVPTPVYAPPPTVYAPPPVEYVPRRPVPVYVAPPEPEGIYVGIRTEGDFYEPLAAYGRWEVVGNYGRCWIPSGVEANWRPYSRGNWRNTDAGWYWDSDEPWGWATYHYGRWDLSPDFGWYWVPQTQWAPAWVSWHRGAGYLGWAPLHPTVGRAGPAIIDVNVRLVAPRAYVFVEEQRFLEPVRPATVVVNNTTIINQTVNITNTKVVNNTVINAGPSPTVIEEVSQQKVRTTPVGELRRKQEANAVARQRAVAPAVERNVAVPQRPAAPAVERNVVAPQRPAAPAVDRSSPAPIRAPAAPVVVQPAPAPRIWPVSPKPTEAVRGPVAPLVPVQPTQRPAVRPLNPLPEPKPWVMPEAAPTPPRNVAAPVHRGVTPPLKPGRNGARQPMGTNAPARGTNSPARGHGPLVEEPRTLPPRPLETR